MAEFEEAVAITKVNTSDVTIELNANVGWVQVGGSGTGGLLRLQDHSDATRITLDASNQRIMIYRADGTKVVELGRYGNLTLGGENQDGDLLMNKANGERTIHLDGDGANLRVGGVDADGDLVLFPGNATNSDDLSQASIHLNGQQADGWFGGNGRDGDLMLFPASTADNRDSSQASIHLDGQQANGWFGGNGRDGDLMLFPASATDTRDSSDASIHLNGDIGDIILKNADCAEEFDLVEGEEREAGTVMVLDQSGKLRPSSDAYDTKVAGVISGAGDYRPGIVLDKKHSRTNRKPLALVGKVYCKVDAEYAPIDVGDLLTTSPTCGHAMKADDPLKAFGAVIGKSLRPLEAGRSLVPILIALQ